MGVLDTPQASDKVDSGRWSPSLKLRSSRMLTIFLARFRWFCRVLLRGLKILSPFEEGHSCAVFHFCQQRNKVQQKQIDVYFCILILFTALLKKRNQKSVDPEFSKPTVLKPMEVL